MSFPVPGIFRALSRRQLARDDSRNSPFSPLGAEYPLKSWQREQDGAPCRVIMNVPCVMPGSPRKKHRDWYNRRQSRVNVYRSLRSERCEVVLVSCALAKCDGDAFRSMVAVLLLAVGVGLGFPAESPADQPRSNLFGCGIVWGNWLQLSDDDAKEWDRRSMDKIVEMGGTNCPANFAWIDIERVRGTYDWDYVDHQVAEATARGLEIFAYSGLTPDWALPPGVLDTYGSGIGYRFPPDEQYIPDFENFFSMLAARYAGQVKYYEFWNEPNGCSWINDGCANGHMAHTYVPWLQRWYTAMNQGDSGCVLAVGGLDYHSGVTNGYQYIEDIYTYGGGDYFDAVAIHPYGDPLHWQAITDTYQVLVNHGDGHKKLWLNEYGWNTTDEYAKAANVTTVLNTLKQPEYNMVFQANHLILTDLPQIPYTNHDYGLCDSDLSTLTITPRQSWVAFRDVDKTWQEYVEFSADVRAGSAPLTVQFMDESTVDNPASWLWEFGDDQTSSQQNPSHTYTADGRYTVRLTEAGSSGPIVEEKIDFIVVDSEAASSLTNPSFEDNGGSLDGWEIIYLNSGPDNPPHNNGSFGIFTTFGDYFAGKVTSWGTFSFRLGQVVQVVNVDPVDSTVDWSLSAYVQMHSRQNDGSPQPANVHQVWEIGWNNDGSMPPNIDGCDNYQTVADIDGDYTGNDDHYFHVLTESGILTEVPGLAYMVIRVRLSNDAGVEWSMSNIDNVAFFAIAATVAPDFDKDGDVDLEDFGMFQVCITGPDDGPPDPGCEQADFDNDNDVDLSDFGLFQRCMSGPNILADAGCDQ